MASIARIRCTWTGFVGAPGVNTFYADPATANPPVTELRAFYAALAASLLPQVCTITVDGAGDTIEDSTGEIDGSWSVSPAPLPVVGGQSGAYPGPCGAVVNWLTAAIIGGRRLRGKSFIVPLTDAAFDADGTLTAAALTTLNNAAAAVVAATNPLRVWHRPSGPGATDGSSSPVTAHRVPDLAAVLRSRRD